MRILKIAVSLIIIYIVSSCTVKVNPEVRMYVENNNIILVSGVGSYDYGNEYLNTSSNKAYFTIVNKGKKTLELTGVPNKVSISGTNATEFIVDESTLKTKIGYNQATLFSITFQTQSLGSKTATVEIKSNDGNFPLYTFNIYGTVVTPEINVNQGNTLIISKTSIYDFKEMCIGFSSNVIPFTISNTGSGILYLSTTSNKITITGASADEFELDQTNISESIEPSGSTTFTISFHPKSIGSKTALVSIKNNDLDENPFTFTIKGLAIDPEILVLDSSQHAIINGSGTYDFGEVLRNTSTEETFTIKNLSSSILLLTGNPRVVITGSGSSNFSVISQPASFITIGSSTTFRVSFTPNLSIDYAVTISFANNDAHDNPYKFTIKGKGIEPEINIHDSSNNNIVSGSGNFDFGNVRVNNSASETFTIQNTGSYNLTLDGTPKIVISGTDASRFTVTGNPSSPITPNNNTTFTIEFVPSDLVICSAIVSIANNDFDENPYTFTINGTGSKPEINVRQGSTDIPSVSGSFDFGDGYVGYPGQAVVFTIENLGSMDIFLNGSQDKIVKSGTGAVMFSIDQTNTSNSISPGDSTTFSITFSPKNAGNKTATISIANNDADENPYTFTIIGAGHTPAPEINIKQGSINIPNSTGEYNFGKIVVGNSSQPITFTIENLGVLNLSLNGSPIVDLLGPDTSEFSLNTSSTSSTIAPSGNTSFTITFTPTRIGSKTLYVSIANDDTDENPYTFTIIAKSYFTRFDFNGDGYEDIIIGAHEDDDGGTNSGCAFIFFGGTNLPSSLEAKDADVKLIGEDAGDYFGISVSTAGDLNKDGYDDVIVGASEDDDGGTDSGCAFIFYGSSNPPTSIDASNADVKLVGADNYDEFGISVSNAGDVNKDGYLDVIVGAWYDDDVSGNSGCAFVFFSSSNMSSVIDASNANIRLVGKYGNFGVSVSKAGDMNNDGFDDVIVGARVDNDGGSSAGCAYVFFGSSNPPSDLYATNASMKLIGGDTGDEFGKSVSYAGDVNKDGFDDVIVGAWEDDDGGSRSGCAFIFFGSSNPTSTIDASNADVKLIGEDKNDILGFSVCNAGDVNGDGYDDVLVGALGDCYGNSYSGSGFLFYGKANWASTIDASNADVRFYGAGYSSHLGGCVSSIGDLNDDGYDDIIVGIHDGNYAYILYGAKNLSTNISSVNADVKLSGDLGSDEFGSSVSGGN